MLGAGDLTHLMTLQAPDVVQSASGAPTEAWQDVTTLWVALMPITGRESAVAKSYSATVSHKVRCRHTCAIKPNHRLIYGCRTFSLNAVLDPDEKRRELLIYATEVV